MSVTSEKKSSLRLMSGNEALARGAWEAGVRVASAYPGTPSTEILEELARLPGIDARWAPNEKVAFDVAAGAYMAGARALVSMKHVGLNVASDSLMTVSYTGGKGALVVVTCDDPEMHSSQNEQDNRLYAPLAGVPLLEPGDSQEAREFALEAFRISAAHDTPVLLRLTTRISHTKGPVCLGEREEVLPSGFERDPEKYVMIPAYARKRHPVVVERLELLKGEAERSPLNRVERGEKGLGIITSGIAYHYVKEVLPRASLLKLGFTFPLPEKLIRDFAGRVGRLLVVEELEPFLEGAISALGLRVEGKALFPRCGELSAEKLREGLSVAGLLPHQEEPPEPSHAVTPRPPVLCPGCSHRGLFAALRRVKPIVAGDIGCYTLSVLPPLSIHDTCTCMGASIGTALGLERAGGEKRPIVAVIGDSTFLHSGIPALIDAVHNGSSITIVILDNRVTAMTGGQHHPGAGAGIHGEPAPRLDLEALVRGIGVRDVSVIDPYDYEETLKAVHEATSSPNLSVLITSRPCVLYPSKLKTTPFEVIPGRCNACGLCFTIGCPAILTSEELVKGKPRAWIDPSLCTGCSVCADICAPGAIHLRDCEAHGS